MPAHVQTALILLGALGLIIGFLVFVNNRDKKKEEKIR